MELICESPNLNDYLIETDEVNFSHPIIKDKANELFNPSKTEVEKTKIAFEFVRDEVDHSWDIQGTRVTSRASDALLHKEGICYVKSMLLAALLRTQNIPTGFCYQRLMIFDSPEKGYSIHALNAVFLQSYKQWVRLDSRGNKSGVDAQFSLNEEKLAFSVDKNFDEKDYPVIYVNPNPQTVSVLKEHGDALKMYKYHLPTHV